MAVTKLVLVRHGESQWNKENRFTGWYDVDLSEKGVSEAKAAGKLLKEEGYSSDFAYTSVLKRAIHTLWNVLDELDQAWLPVEKSWKLNERHYGALQGLNEAETAEKYGLVEGVYVREVYMFSAAEKAGIKVGDVITELNGQSVKTVNDMNKIKNKYNIGDTLQVTINRDGKEMSLNLILLEYSGESTTKN